MSRGSFWLRGVAALLLVGLIVAGGLGLHYVAWSRGYQAGQLAAGGEGEVVAAPAYVPRGLYPVLGAPYPFRAGLLFKIVLGVFFLVLIGKLIHLVVWGAMFHPAMRGPWSPQWHRAYRSHATHWHRMHGPVPPWFWWGEPPAEEASAGGGEPGAAQ